MINFKLERLKKPMFAPLTPKKQLPCIMLGGCFWVEGLDLEIAGGCLFLIAWKGVSLMVLTKKQKIFADEYLIDLNATRAYKAAYPKVKKDESARVNGSKLLTNTNVAEYIQKRMDDRTQRTEITQDKVLRELAKLGFFDARKLFADNGQPIGIKDLDDDTAACIVGIKVKEIYDKDGKFEGYEKEYKLADKKGSLELIGRHLGIFRDKVELAVDTSEKLDDILSQMGGEGLDE